jgi:putative transcriptional regulator
VGILSRAAVELMTWFISDRAIDTWGEDFMACGDGQSLQAAQSTLRQAGFNVSQPCSSRPSCFDFAARKEKTLIFVRAQPDIGCFSTGDSQEMRAISGSFSATSLLIGKQTREKPLEDDTVYTRHEIPAITSRTFENVILHRIPPLVKANPGGYYVDVDGEALKKKRQELGLSVGEMAAMVGTSRRTIYGYERGMAKASVMAAYNMISVLGIPVARPINVLETSRLARSKCMLTTARMMFNRNKLLTKFFQKYLRCAVTTFRKAPFDFVISSANENMRIMGGVANDREKDLEKRVGEILSLSQVVQARPILITENQEHGENSIPCISSEEISRIKNPEDLFAGVR